MALTPSQRRVREGCTALYTATIQDEANDPLLLTDLTTLTLTLYDKTTGSIINSRDDQDVKNTNGVTVSAGGVLVWTMSPADNVIVGAPSRNQPEQHVALFEWTWDTGTKAGKYEVQIDVEQLTKVT
jgi:hypothetical protein